VGESYQGPCSEVTDRGVRGSERDVREYVSVDHPEGTSICLVGVGNAGVGFNFLDVG